MGAAHGGAGGGQGQAGQAFVFAQKIGVGREHHVAVEVGFDELLRRAREAATTREMCRHKHKGWCDGECGRHAHAPAAAWPAFPASCPMIRAATDAARRIHSKRTRPAPQSSSV